MTKNFSQYSYMVAKTSFVFGMFFVASVVAIDKLGSVGWLVIAVTVVIGFSVFDQLFQMRKVKDYILNDIRRIAEIANEGVNENILQKSLSYTAWASIYFFAAGLFFALSMAEFKGYATMKFMYAIFVGNDVIGLIYLVFAFLFGALAAYLTLLIYEETKNTIYRKNTLFQVIHNKKRAILAGLLRK